MPVRIQRRRTKGWRMPEGAVYVGRPGPWGNPFVVRRDVAVPPIRARMWGVFFDGRLLVRWDTKTLAATDAVERYRRLIQEHRVLLGVLTSQYENRRELAGKDLVCWCALDQPCHADVLLEIANGPTIAERREA